MKYFRIYGKEKTAKRFKAFDYNAGAFVDNLLFATIIKESEHEKAKRAVEYMNNENPNYIFELRGV